MLRLNEGKIIFTFKSLQYLFIMDETLFQCRKNSNRYKVTYRSGSCMFHIGKHCGDLPPHKLFFVRHYTMPCAHQSEIVAHAYYLQTCKLWLNEKKNEAEISTRAFPLESPSKNVNRTNTVNFQCPLDFRSQKNEVFRFP